jgi:hypothetical protein
MVTFILTHSIAFRSNLSNVYTPFWHPLYSRIDRQQVQAAAPSAELASSAPLA